MSPRTSRCLLLAAGLAVLATSCSSAGGEGTLSLHVPPCPGPGIAPGTDQQKSDTRARVPVSVTKDGISAFNGKLRHPWHITIQLHAGTYQVSAPGHRLTTVQVRAHHDTVQTPAPNCL